MSTRALRLKYLYDLADSLSSVLEVPVEITSNEFERIVLSDHDASGAPVSRLQSTPASLARSISSDNSSTPRVVRHAGVAMLGIPGFTAIPLTARVSGEVVAYVWLIEISGSLPEAAVQYAEVVAASTFRALSKLAVELANSDRASEERRLLLECDAPEFLTELSAVAVRKGMQQQTPVIAIAVAVEARDRHYETVERLRTSLLRMRELLRDSGRARRSIFASTSTEVLMLVGAPSGVDPALEADELIATLQDGLFRARARGFAKDWSIGVSPLPVEWVRAHDAVWQARRAAAIGRRIAWKDARIDWSDARPFQTVTNVGVGTQKWTDAFLTPRLDDFLKNPEHDDLVRTLRAYLRHAGNVQAVATEQFLHRGTVYYRLRRIETLLEVDLADGNDRLTLHLGLLSSAVVDTR